jgi:hypothetical protein
MPQTLTLPPAVIFESDDAESSSVLTSQRFPHTRAQLLAIIRQQKSAPDGFDGDGDVDESIRISTSFVTKVAGFLANEQEDELKESLKTTCGVEDDMVSPRDACSCPLLLIFYLLARTTCLRFDA